MRIWSLYICIIELTSSQNWCFCHVAQSLHIMLEFSCTFQIMSFSSAVCRNGFLPTVALLAYQETLPVSSACFLLLCCHYWWLYCKILAQYVFQSPLPSLMYLSIVFVRLRSGHRESLVIGEKAICSNSQFLANDLKVILSYCEPLLLIMRPGTPCSPNMD